MKEQLREAGLTENESKVYIALLELGGCNAGLITRKSGLHRRVVYDVLDMLAKKGLIGYIIQNGKRLYQAADPKRFIDLIEERRNGIEEVMPRMMELFTKTRESEGTNFYKGKAGLKSVFEDQLNTGNEILIIGGSENAYQVLEFYFKWYDLKRKEKKIKVRAIFNSGEKKFKIPLADVRYLPERYSSPLAVNIYGDKVALILWDKESPLAIVIKNRKISEGYRKYFELTWRVARK
ncbi:MAG: helix-turn-helix domain-containing protein [Nanoarchaeota archaeon]